MRTRITFGLVAAFVASVAIGAGDEAARSKPNPVAPTREPVDCGAAGIDVTVALSYNRDNLGFVAATHADVDFREPLSLPQSATPEKLRSRLKSLLPSEHHVGLAKDEKAGRVRVTLTTSEAGIPPGNAFTLHFDCPAGSHVRPTDLTCTTGEVVDGAGLPMAEALARTVTCVVTQIAPSE